MGTIFSGVFNSLDYEQGNVEESELRSGVTFGGTATAVDYFLELDHVGPALLANFLVVALITILDEMLGANLPISSDWQSGQY